MARPKLAGRQKNEKLGGNKNPGSLENYKCETQSGLSIPTAAGVVFGGCPNNEPFACKDCFQTEPFECPNL